MELVFIKDDYSSKSYLNIGGGLFANYLHGIAWRADAWRTARTLTIGNTSKDVDGTANVSWNLAEIGINQPSEIFNNSATLKVDTWTNMATINTLDAGTYTIQINSGNVYASGIFTACGGTDSVIDEIPLHVSDKGTNTWRPYARVSGNNLQMTTNETTGTARTYTIKILKLI